MHTLIAVTGSIGTGKTTLATLANELGYNVYDVDSWVRRLYFQKEFIAKIMQNFPGSVDHGKFNKRKLRHIVFNDNNELKRLEALIHPFLDQTLKNIVHKKARSNFVSFIDVALLFEMGWDKYADLIIVTDVPYEVQKQRVIKRDNVTEEHFEQINGVQMSNKKKMKLADLVIDTNKPLNLLKLELIEILENL